MSSLLESYPWLIPGMAVAMVIAVPLSTRVGRWLGVRRLVAWLLLVDVGAALAGTLPPPGCSCVVETSRGICDLSRIGPPALSELARPTDVWVNLLMLVPLGFAISVAPSSGRKATLLAAAVALPFMIEAVQLVATDLHRACQSADVVDNVTGLLLGLIAGAVAMRLVPALRLTDRPSARDA